MVNSNRERDVEAVDAFLARPKTLSGLPPEWKQAARPGEFEVVWPILNDLGITVGQLRFRTPRHASIWPSVSVIFRDFPIWRIDLVANEECKPNPSDAHQYGLPPWICGPHEHAWPDNREHILSSVWELPYRRLINPSIRRVEQILPVIADKIGLTLSPDQRYFDGPKQSDLFGPGR